MREDSPGLKRVQVKLLVVNHYAGAASYGMEYRIYYMAKEWVKAGHEVTILAASHSHIRARQPSVSGRKSVEMVEGIRYVWYRTRPYHSNGAMRVLNMCSFLRALFFDRKRIADEYMPDVVISSNTYPMDIYISKSIAKRAGARLIFEVRDLWPLSPMELGGMSRYHPFIMWCQAAEGYAYRNADAVVSSLPKAEEYMRSRGMGPGKFNFIPNGVDEEEWSNTSKLPVAIAAEIEAIRLRGKPIVGYAGNHGVSNALDMLLDAARIGADKFEVVMVGKGPERDRLLKRVRDEDIKNVTMLSVIDKSAVPAFLDSVDIAFIGWSPNPMYRFGISPNKLMDYMMAAKPVIHAVVAGNDPVAEVGCGITIKPDDPEGLCAAVEILAGRGEKAREEMGERGRSHILREHTYEVLSKRFVDVIRSAGVVH